MIFFISDTHFNHDNILKYCNRPFKNVEEMDKTIINNWNKKITNHDTVYIIGDFALAPESLFPYYTSNLNGNKIFLHGDHDHKILNQYAPYLLNITIEKQKITLCHWSLLSWKASHYNSWMLYGHHHYNTNIDLKFDGKTMNVCVDIHNFFPVSMDEVSTFMNSRNNNWNYLYK